MPNNIKTIRQSKHDEFYKWRGLSVGVWADVERELFQLCKLALSTDDKRAAIIFFTQTTIGTRLNIIDELLKASLPEPAKKNGGHPHPMVKKWNCLCKRLKDLIPVRNNIVHEWAVENQIITPDPINQTAKLEIEYMVIVNILERLRGKKTEVKHLKTSNLEEHFASVKALINDLRDYAKEFAQGKF